MNDLSGEVAGWWQTGLNWTGQGRPKGGQTGQGLRTVGGGGGWRHCGKTRWAMEVNEGRVG